MKCSKCGFKARDINGMRKHYLKKHPGAMKHKGPRKKRRRDVSPERMSYRELLDDIKERLYELERAR